jgi:di/tricarboxylate transporter
MVQPLPTSLWDRFDGAHKTATKPSKRRFRWVVDVTVPLILLVVVAIAVLLPIGLSTEARYALFSFAFAVILWSTTSLNAAYVALVSVLLLVLSGGEEQEVLFEALESDVIWLMIGAFMLGAAVQKTGLAGRLTQWVIARARSVQAIFWLLTTILIPLTFLIPSTSGRAAVVIPIFRSLSNTLQDRKITRALALLIPSIILVSTIVALVGAGSHLIALDLLDEATDQTISFTQWALYGLPFGVIASYATCGVILWLFLDRERCDRALNLPEVKRRPLSQAERNI